MRIAVFTIALAVRIAAVELTGAGKIAFGDGPDYVAHAASICTAGVYPERGNLPFFRAPGLPFFIAAVTACEPDRTRAIKYGLAVADAVTVLLIFLIAGIVWPAGAGPVAPVAAAMAALHPFFVGSVTDIRTEPLFTMLLVASMWLMLRSQPVAAGAVLALAALTRPTALLCIPLFALYLARDRRLRPAAAFLCAAVLTLSPWVVRNGVRFHELIVVNDAGGFNFWRGTHPELARVVATRDRAEFARRSLLFESMTVSEAAAVVASRASTPAARDREWRRLAFRNLRSDPRFAAGQTLRKALLYWRPWLHPAEHGAKAVAMSAVLMAGLYLFGAAGLRLHRDRSLVIAVLVFFAMLWLAHLPYYPSIRIRSPLTDPLLIVFAAGAVVATAGRFTRRSAGHG